MMRLFNFTHLIKFMTRAEAGTFIAHPIRTRMLVIQYETSFTDFVTPRTPTARHTPSMVVLITTSYDASPTPNETLKILRRRKRNLNIPSNK